MPKTSVIFYHDAKGIPFLAWLDDVRENDIMGWANCVARLELLEDEGTICGDRQLTSCAMGSMSCVPGMDVSSTGCCTSSTVAMQ